MPSSIVLYLVLSVLLTAGTKTVYAQAYGLTSQEGRPAAVHLSYKLFSKRLAVACAGDTLFLPDYQGTISVKTLRDRFLLVTYQARCGTSCSVQNTAIVTVSKQKARLALLMRSAADSENLILGHEMKSHYRVTLSMPGDAVSPYTMRAHVNQEKTFLHNPTQNQRRHQEVVLRWNAAQQVFQSKERL